ncbi:MAG: [citrate (pro-3S)-lyase] ligase [Bacteroidia bacterium]|nr:MAG: [citrate (pro-3S)-lyase] ligase [Bacteroidia bacterium]
MDFENTDFRQEMLDPRNPYDARLVADFLASMGFTYRPEEVDASMIVYNLNDRIIATGSMQNRTLKYVAVDPKFRESSAFAQVVTFLSGKILEQHRHCFVFTKPETANRFEGLGFTLIAKAEPLFSVLEFGYKSIKDFQDQLATQKKETQTNDVAALVMNCNPFTNGHKFLIEKAASENEQVYLFVVEDSQSSFPFEVRKRLIEEGTAHLKNVRVLASGPYIVSGAIFPNYFIKNTSWNLVTQKQAEIDVKIFAKYIVPVLGIKKRYIGKEHYCHTTAAYNEAMHKILPKYGVQVVEVERIDTGIDETGYPIYISASKVREAIKKDSLESVRNFLPETTYRYLASEASADIRKLIKESDQRH